MPSAYIDQCKQKFHHKDGTNLDKIKILTLMPKTWSVRKVAHTMKTSRYLADKEINLAERK